MKRLLKYFSRADFGVVGILILVAAIGFLFNLRQDFSKGEFVLVRYRNRVLYRLSIHEDRSLSVNGDSGGLVLQIRRGKVWVSQSQCPHKTCMRMGKISHPGQIIVCVPNRIVIQIVGRGNPTFDVITQ